jgi:addiction module HigA family antidote
MIPIKKRPLHPGPLLRQNWIIKERMNVSKFARLFNIPMNELGPFLNGEAPLTEPMAKAFARVFGTSPLFWLRQQEEYDAWEKRDKLLRSLLDASHLTIRRNNAVP